MTERVQIIVEATDSASGVLRAITSQFGQMGSLIEDLLSPTQNWGNIAFTATSMVIDGMKDAVNETVKYANEVRQLSAISGESAENASRFIQVLDDFKIGADDALTATRALTKQGLAPNIETLAQLSDQYLALNDAQARNEFVLKNLGRAGLQWTEVLSKGGVALRQMGDAVSENLILNEEGLRTTREYEIALDNWNDSIQGLKISIGEGLLPVITGAINRTNDLARAHELAAEKGLTWAFMTQQQIDALVAEAAAEREATSALMLNTDATNANGDAVQQLSVDYRGLISDIQSMQKETDRYKDTNSELFADNHALRIEMGNLQEELKRTEKQYGSNSEQAQGLRDEILKINGKITDNTVKLRENEEEHKRWAAQTVYSFAMARAAADGNISEGEGQILIDMGVQLGLFDRQTAAAMESVNKAFDSVDSSNAQEMIDAMYESLQKLTGQTWIIPVEYGGPIPGESTGYILPPHESTDGLAAGGPAYAGSAYVVGERGPEVFMPSENGSVIPNNQLQMNYFYGPTSLVVSGDGAEGLLGLRV